METAQQLYNAGYAIAGRKKSILSQFIDWCKGQEENRFGWLAVILAGHGCVLTPITVFAIAFAGNSMLLWSGALAAMGMCLVTNLAAMPTKITIPVFLFSVLLDLVIIGMSVGGG